VFNWAVVSDVALSESERVGQMRVRISDWSVEKTSPMVWSAVAICDLMGGPKKEISAALIVCHLSERLLFANDRDDEINRLEQELESVLKGAEPWEVSLS
jgi:hypothetical protein